MDKGTQLEQAIFDVIQEVLESEDDIEVAKKYFKDVFVTEMIKEATD